MNDVFSFCENLSKREVGKFVETLCSSDKFWGVEDFINTVMVHMLGGPIDMNNGFYALNTLQERKTAGLDYKIPYPPVESTVAAENARVVITDGGMSVLPDAPWEYENKSDFFGFIRALPNNPWDETRVLRAELNTGVTTARRSGKEWFVGSVVNEEGGETRIKLDFLQAGIDYTATLYEDTQDSHFENNKEAYQIREIKVTAGDSVTAKMAPGGGHAIWIRPAGN